jgi:hypothetical protein
MARSIEQVGHDLIQLKTTSGEVGRELTAVYRSYFSHLATALRQQSIQSCYHLCTNCYPDAFLQLNYNQRSQLLKTLQRVIGNVTVRLISIIDPIPDRVNHGDDDDEPTGELTSMQVTPIDWFDTPLSLSTWQQNLEVELLHRTKEISYKVNLLLQQAQIAPANIPKPILEADPEADSQADGVVNAPNILSVFIEQASIEEQQLGDNENAEDDDLNSIIKIHSLYLRLTEVEFSDGTVLSLRKNINQLVNKVSVLRREYLQKQQELKIAEAESAWRNSWFED